MKVRWNYNQPRSFGLKSGASLYCFSKGQELYISGYDWFNSPSLKPWKDLHFTVIDDSDDQPNTTVIVTKEKIKEDKPKIKFEQQSMTLTQDNFGTLSTRPLTEQEKVKKVVKKHIKKREKDVIIS